MRYSLRVATELEDAPFCSAGISGLNVLKCATRARESARARSALPISERTTTHVPPIKKVKQPLRKGPSTKKKGPLP